MLTITDLSVSKELDHAAMTTVRGGHRKAMPGPASLSVINAPEFDLSRDIVDQFQSSVIDQSGNWGGVNLAFNYQNQNATA